MHALKKLVPLKDFLETNEGFALWDSQELRLILNEQTVFILIANYEVKSDLIGLLGADNEFTPVADTLIVQGVATIDEDNYIFVDEIFKQEGNFFLKVCSNDYDDEDTYYLINDQGEQVSPVMTYVQAILLAEKIN